MNDKLQEIIAVKREEVAFLKQNRMSELTRVLEGEIRNPHQNRLMKCLSSSELSIIAEIKRSSPSKGHIAAIKDPLLLAEKYIVSGADAISILTDQQFFSGSLQDLTAVANYPKTSVPLLRKDFIIDPLQIAEAVLAGASAILLIVAALGRDIKPLLHVAKQLRIDALVEVHNEEELDLALEEDAEIIGVNNRNLKTFVIDTEQSFKLVEKMPKSIIKVAESGIFDPLLAHAYHQAGYQGALIGEALVTATDPKQFIAACKSGKIC